MDARREIHMSELAGNLPDGTPPKLRRVFAIAVAIAALIGVAAYALEKIKPVGSDLYAFCRYTYVCAPAPLKELRPLASGYAKGNTARRAANDQFIEYSRDNPDWNICLTNVRSLSKSGPFNSNVEYRMEGTFFGVPKWRGLFEKISDFINGRTYTFPACPKE